MCREALPHSSPPSRGQASCSALHGSVTHADSATGLEKLLGTILESIAGRVARGRPCRRSRSQKHRMYSCRYVLVYNRYKLNIYVAQVCLSISIHRQRRCSIHGHSRRDSEHHGGEQSRIQGIRVVCVHIHTGNRSILLSPQPGRKAGRIRSIPSQESVDAGSNV